MVIEVSKAADPILAYVDQGLTSERSAKVAADHGIALEVVKLAKHIGGSLSDG